MKPLTISEIENSIGYPIWVEDLEFESAPRCVHPAIVFDWRFEDPFDNNFSMSKRINKITVVQPSATIHYTKYWKIEDYGKTWIAFKSKFKEK